MSEVSTYEVSRESDRSERNPLQVGIVGVLDTLSTPIVIP
jgi:hypothetical protein